MKKLLTRSLCRPNDFVAISDGVQLCAELVAKPRSKIDVITMGLTRGSFLRECDLKLGLARLSRTSMCVFAAHDISLPHKGGQYVRGSLTFLAVADQRLLLGAGI